MRARRHQLERLFEHLLDNAIRYAPEGTAVIVDVGSTTSDIVPIIDGTIPHDIVGEHGAGRVLLRPASQGTGVIAGGAVRALLEAAGVSNVLTKCIGSNNAHNVVHATVAALQQLTSPESVSERRGKSVEDMGYSIP